MLPNINPKTTASWRKLHTLSEKYTSHIKALLHDPNRSKRLRLQVDDLFFDFSKNNLSTEVLDTLLQLCEECKLKEAIEAQFTGDHINETEDRAVLHTLLRDPDNNSTDAGLVKTELKKIEGFVSKVHSGEWKGFTGKPITDVVNIGIGGSDLGPKMVAYALRPYWKGITPHFISNVDAAQIAEELVCLNPETTLFIIASKTFTTQETMTNAATARSWFLKRATEDDIAQHFVAVSTNEQAVVSFGIDPDNMFIFWDWVGGRYSLWSAIGLSIAVVAGYNRFEELLRGANKMDRHFRNTTFEANIPIISALIGVWYNNFLGYGSKAILPYDHRLRYLPSYLQQGDMESNGKSVDRSGQPVSYQTGPIIWGEPGTNGQHAFYQLIHQGTKIIPCEFVAFAKSAHPYLDHHEKLLANFFAQPEALLNGKTKETVEEEMNGRVNRKLAPFKVFSGNRPSTSILIKELTPENLGTLIAYYEHIIFVQGVIWNIFSYDQWGVELGKQLAKPILAELKNKKMESHDDSTTSLIKAYFEFIS